MVTNVWMYSLHNQWCIYGINGEEYVSIFRSQKKVYDMFQTSIFFKKSYDTGYHTFLAFKANKTSPQTDWGNYS